jgi:hypothetical protein
MRFVMSKIADGEWCAHTTLVKSNITAQAVTEILALKMGLLDWNAPQYSTGPC